ncbi:MAG: tetratricopeptide repeat protein [Ardenticatenaceae bacterium]|nr:tetratricopeptide repeat protein [Ardenticatenaceae bacterium]
MTRRKAKDKKVSQTQSAASLWQNGKRSFQQKNYASAIDAWERARQKEPKVVQDAALAEAYFRRGMKTPTTQADDLEKAVALRPQEAVYAYHLALLRHKQGKLAEAVAGYEQVAKAGEAWQKRVAYPLALAYQQQGKDVEKRPVWGYLSGEEQMMLRMAAALQKGTEVITTDVALWQGVGEVANGRLPQAVPHLEAASQQPGNKGISHYYLGVAAAGEGDWETAVRHWSTAQAAGFRSPHMQANLGELYHRAAESRWQRQEMEAALAAAVEANQFKDNDKQLAELIAHLYQEMGYQSASRGDWETALANWQLAEEEAGNNFRLACNLALAYEQAEDWEMAAELWRKALRHRPRKADHPDAVGDDEIARLWLRSALAYHKIEAYEESVQVFKNAVKWQPDNLEIRLGLVTALLNNGQAQAAVNELDRILQKDPKNVPALIRMGEVLQEGGYYWQAPVPYWERALKVDPNNDTAKQYLAEHHIEEAARWLEWRDDYQQALAQYEKAYAYQPQNGELLIFMADCYLRLGQIDKGQSLIDEALRLHPTSESVYGQVLVTWLMLDEDEKAWQALAQAEQAMPGLSATFYLTIAGKCFVADDAKQGQPWLERAVQKATLDEPVFIMIGEMLTLLCPQHYELIEGYLQQAVKANQMPGHAYLLMGILAMHQRDERQAKSHWKTAEKIARRERDQVLLERIQEAKAMFSSPFGGLLSRMMGGGGSPLDMLRMMQMLEEMDEDNDEEDLFW